MADRKEYELAIKMLNDFKQIDAATASVNKYKESLISLEKIQEENARKEEARLKRLAELESRRNIIMTGSGIASGGGGGKPPKPPIDDKEAERLQKIYDQELIAARKSKKDLEQVLIEGRARLEKQHALDLAELESYEAKVHAAQQKVLDDAKASVVKQDSSEHNPLRDSFNQKSQQLKDSGLNEKTQEFVKNIDKIEKSSSNAGRGMLGMGQAIRHLQYQFPLLSEVMRAFFSPITAFVFAAVTAFQTLKAEIEEVGNATTPAWEKITDKTILHARAVNEVTLAYDSFRRSLSAIAQTRDSVKDIFEKSVEVNQEKFDSAISSLENLLKAETVMIENQEKAGIISHQQYLDQKYALDVNYFKKKLALQLAELNQERAFQEQKIANYEIEHANLTAEEPSLKKKQEDADTEKKRAEETFNKKNEDLTKGEAKLKEDEEWIRDYESGGFSKARKEAGAYEKHLRLTGSRKYGTVVADRNKSEIYALEVENANLKAELFGGTMWAEAGTKAKEVSKDASLSAVTTRVVNNANAAADEWNKHAQMLQHVTQMLLDLGISYKTEKSKIDLKESEAKKNAAAETNLEYQKRIADEIDDEKKSGDITIGADGKPVFGPNSKLRQSTWMGKNGAGVSTRGTVEFIPGKDPTAMHGTAIQEFAATGSTPRQQEIAQWEQSKGITPGGIGSYFEIQYDPSRPKSPFLVPKAGATEPPESFSGRKKPPVYGMAPITDGAMSGMKPENRSADDYIKAGSTRTAEQIQKDIDSGKMPGLKTDFGAPVPNKPNSTSINTGTNAMQAAYQSVLDDIGAKGLETAKLLLDTKKQIVRALDDVHKQINDNKVI